jgi:hypothetical protein
MVDCWSFPNEDEIAKRADELVRNGKTQSEALEIARKEHDEATNAVYAAAYTALKWGKIGAVAGLFSLAPVLSQAASSAD